MDGASEAISEIAASASGSLAVTEEEMYYTIFFCFLFLLCAKCYLIDEQRILGEDFEPSLNSEV